MEAIQRAREQQQALLEAASQRALEQQKEVHIKYIIIVRLTLSMIQVIRK